LVVIEHGKLKSGNKEKVFIIIIIYLSIHVYCTLY